MVSGGSTTSASVIMAALTVTVQRVFVGSTLVGCSVKVVAGDAVSTVNGRGTLAGQTRVKAPLAALTLSLKVTVISPSIAVGLVPSAGVVVVTVGALSVAETIDTLLE